MASHSHYIHIPSMKTHFCNIIGVKRFSYSPLLAVITQKQGVFWFNAVLTGPEKKKDLKTLLCYIDDNHFRLMACCFGVGLVGVFLDSRGVVYLGFRVGVFLVLSIQ